MMLNDMMEFDHVIQVHPDGSVTDAPAGIYAPNVYDGELEPGSIGWTLLDGYSGQDSYSGPIMHNSEYVGEGCTLERDILAQPGYYACVVCTWLKVTADDEDDMVEGWAVAFHESETSNA